MQKHKKAFTLVELIVVITILAILGTIAFISLQGYSKDARDSVRISDISKIKTSLELFQLDAGKYPETTDPTTITYSGAIAWTQGTFGETTYSNVSKLDKIPTDPVTDRKYVYSVTNTKQEYQIAGIMEGDEVTGFLNQTNAAQKTVMLKISGSYNGKVLKVSTGSIDYVLAVPSIITSSGFTLETIVQNNYLAYNGYKNLPSQYAGSSYDVLGDDGLYFVNNADLVVFSGSLKTLSSSEQVGIDARKNLIIKLKSAYSGTAITNVGEIAQIINTSTEDPTATEFLGATIVSNNLGGSITVSIPRVNACATQPEYTGATYEIGVATEPDQAWQSSNASAPCYWTCGTGKVLDENTCVSELCDGISPDGTVKVSNATSYVGGTWTYNTTPGQCTYSCGTQYHTEDNNTCISNTKSCTITNGIGQQTWNGTSRGACTVLSCTGGYTGTNCEIAPTFLLNCTANGQIYYADSSGNKLATVTNAGVATWVSGKSILDLTCVGNIIVCSGNSTGYILQACNVGADTMGTDTTSSYGGLFQWGNHFNFRYNQFTNGQLYPITSTIQVSSIPNYSTYSTGTFVKVSDWTSLDSTGALRSANWNTCSTGYHIPTNVEWVAAITAGSWGTTLSTNMMNTLKLPMAGYRTWGNVSLYGQGTIGTYWSSSPDGTNGSNLYFDFTSINPTNIDSRARTYSVRCFKN